MDLDGPQKKILIFCGGRGSGELANQLVERGHDVTVCVNAYDDGLSTGRLRQMFDCLGPSDIRKNLLSLMDLDAAGYWSRFEAFSYRYDADEARADEFRRELESVITGVDTSGPRTNEFSRLLGRTSDEFREVAALFLKVLWTRLLDRERDLGVRFSFSDCAVGNLILLGAVFEHGDSWSAGIEAVEDLLRTRGHVVLVSEDVLHLSAMCTDGRLLSTEASVISNSNGDISQLFLTAEPVDKIGAEQIAKASVSEISITDVARSAISSADLLIYGSGTFHSSILPTLMIGGVKQAIGSNPNEKLLILNLVDEPDTRGFKGIDLVRKVAELVGADSITKIAVNHLGQHSDDSYFTLTPDDLAGIGVVAEILYGDYESRTRPGRHDALLLVESLESSNIKALVRTRESKLPLVSILMLAWNRLADVKIGLDEMKKLSYPNLEFIVVDNGSTDGTTAYLREHYPYVDVVKLHKNTGMTGYNVGLSTARGKYIVMLDDDSHLVPDAVSKMVEAWETEDNRDVGVMAFRVINPNSGSLVTHLWEERLIKVEPGREREITSFAACGAAASREALDKVGYFDDDFFLYATEDDLSIRMWDAGFKIVYEPRCVSHHRESQTMRNWKRYGFGFRNATWFNLKHLPVYMIPMMLIRNLFWLIVRSFRFRSFQYFWYGLVGLIKGYFQLSAPLSKRRVVRSSIAKFCLADNWITRPIISTTWKIYKDKRYILDKRGVSPGLK